MKIMKMKNCCPKQNKVFINSLFVGNVSFFQGHSFFLIIFVESLFVKLIDTLAQHIRIDDEIRYFFENEVTTRTFQKNEIISTQDQYNRNVYFVDEGLARMFYYENGKDITTNFFTEGKIFANIDTIFKDSATRYNMETIEESVIAYCSYRKLEELCNVSLTAANFSRYVLGNLMMQMSLRISSLQYMTAKEKYKNLLDENPGIILRAPLGMIATYLGISQETLSRIRSEV